MSLVSENSDPGQMDLKKARSEKSSDTEGVRLNALLQIITSIIQADSVQTAAAKAFQLLHQHFNISALALDVVSSESSVTFSYGDSNALAAPSALNETAESAVNMFRYPLQIGNLQAGSITFVLSSDFLNADSLSSDSLSSDSLNADALNTDSLTFEGVPPSSLSNILKVVVMEIARRCEMVLLIERAEEAEEKARHRIREVGAIYEIGQAIDTLELPRLLQMIVERTVLLMDAEACSLLLIDEDTPRLRLAASHGLAEDVPEYGQRVGEGIAGRVAETEQPLLIVGSGQDPRLDGVALKPEIGSAMLVPMKDQTGKVLGVLSIRRRRPSADFTNDDLKLFSVFASQAALAVTNVRLYDNLKRRAAELLKLSTLSRALISTIDLDQLLERVVDEVQQVANFQRCCIYMRDPIRPLYVPRVWKSYPSTIGRNPVHEKEGAVGWAAHTRQILTFDSRDPVDAKQERDRTYLLMKGFARSLGTDSFVVAPIIGARDRCVGVLVADNKGRLDPISQEQKSLLAAFVGQAGIAIDNSLLYVQMQDTVVNLRRLKDYTDNVLQSIGAAIVSTDARGVISRWNRAAEQTLGQSAAAFRDVPIAELIDLLRLPAVEREGLLGLIRQVQETGQNVQRLRMTLHLGAQTPMTIYLKISRLPDHNQEEAGVVLIFEDVTQEIRLEAELEKMRRLADIGQLAARMAHEVRNALSPIRGAAQIIRSETDLPESAPEWLDIIIAEVDGLSRLTSEMLDFARPMSLNLRSVDMNGFLDSAVQSLSTFLLEHNVWIEWDRPESLPELTADPAQLGQVVRNVVMNAAQVMQGGGMLRISVSFDPMNSMFLLAFQDEGPGIAPGYHERIFQPFFTTRTKGTGLGLPIVRKIVEQHGGQVTVDSAVGKGATFRIQLPLCPPAETPFAPETPVSLGPESTDKFPDR